MRLAGSRWQGMLVLVLFVGSLGVLLYNVFASLQLPRQEQQVRERLVEAGQRLAEAARKQRADLPDDYAPALSEALRKLTSEVLADYKGVEGGFSDGTWFGG